MKYSELSVGARFKYVIGGLGGRVLSKWDEKYCYEVDEYYIFHKNWVGQHCFSVS